MREIGKRFDASSHDVGRWLTEIGLRTQYKEPSQAALAGGYCKRQAMDGPGTLVVWNVAKAVAALEKAGHRQIVKPPPMPIPKTNRLDGPFTLERNAAHVVCLRRQFAGFNRSPTARRDSSPRCGAFRAVPWIGRDSAWTISGGVARRRRSWLFSTIVFPIFCPRFALPSSIHT